MNQKSKQKANRFRFMLQFLLSKILQFLPLALVLVIWQIITGHSDRLTFLFGSPVLVAKAMWNALFRGSLLTDSFVTFIETMLGFIGGNILGSLIGLSLWFSRKVARIARPYIIALGSVPIFALAPMLIIWFGTGLFSKIIMASFSTFIVAAVQAYNGAQNVDKDQIMLLRTFGARRKQIFIKVIIPSSLIWVFASYKINIGFALLGAFIGELISSEKGLGHLIMRAGGLYNIPLVFVGIAMFIAIALVLSFIVGLFEKIFMSWRSS